MARSFRLDSSALVRPAPDVPFLSRPFHPLAFWHAELLCNGVGSTRCGFKALNPHALNPHLAPALPQRSVCSLST